MNRADAELKFTVVLTQLLCFCSLRGAAHPRVSPSTALCCVGKPPLAASLQYVIILPTHLE